MNTKHLYDEFYVALQPTLGSQLYNYPLKVSEISSNVDKTICVLNVNYSICHGLALRVLLQPYRLNEE